MSGIKSRIAIDEILRGLSRLNGHAQDVLIHKVDVQDYKTKELMSYTIEQVEVEIESLKIKVQKIKDLIQHLGVESAAPTPIRIPEPTPPPQTPQPLPELVAPKIAESSTPLQPPEIKEINVKIPTIDRKPRIRLEVQKEPPIKDKELLNKRIVYPSVRR